MNPTAPAVESLWGVSRLPLSLPSSLRPLSSTVTPRGPREGHGSPLPLSPGRLRRAASAVLRVRCPRFCYRGRIRAYAPPPPPSSFQAPCASPPSHALPAPCPPRCTLRFALLSDDNPRGPPASYFFVSVALSLSPLPSPSVSVPCQVCVVHPSHANPCLSVDPMVCYTGVALSCRRATCPGPSRRGAHALPATVSAVRTGRTIGSHLNLNLTYLTQPCGRGPLPVAQAAFPTVGAYCQPRASPPARPPTPNTHRAPFPGGPAPHMRPLGLASHVGARPPLSAHRASIPFRSKDWYPTPVK
jgi:hypothetical protein